MVFVLYHANSFFATPPGIPSWKQVGFVNIYNSKPCDIITKRLTKQRAFPFRVDVGIAPYDYWQHIV